MQLTNDHIPTIVHRLLNLGKQKLVKLDDYLKGLSEVFEISMFAGNVLVLVEGNFRHQFKQMLLSVKSGIKACDWDVDGCNRS